MEATILIKWLVRPCSAFNFSGLRSEAVFVELVTLGYLGPRHDLLCLVRRDILLPDSGAFPWRAC